MSSFSNLSSEERAAFVAEAAARRGISEVIVEKDAWVSWLLRELFAHPVLARHLLFKGGTSLSKGYGLIQRFSEDIDLGVDPEHLGFGAERVAGAQTRRARAGLMVEMQRACGHFVKTEIQARLSQSANARFASPSCGAWVAPAPEDPHGAVLLFTYPSCTNSTSRYIRKGIRLEFGALTEQRPLAPLPIRTILCDVLGESFADLQCVVFTLAAGRTFWEKATILHDCALQPPARPLRRLYARHYSDFAVLWGECGMEFARDRALLQAVALHKERFFQSSWSDYRGAWQRWLRLSPPEHRVRELRLDYESMRPMFLVEPPSFERMLETIAAAEAAIDAK